MFPGITDFFINGDILYSDDTIYHATFEKNVLVKGAHDQDAADMFRIIFDSKCYNLTFLTNWATGQAFFKGWHLMCRTNSHPKPPNTMK